MHDQFGHFVESTSPAELIAEQESEALGAQNCNGLASRNSNSKQVCNRQGGEASQYDRDDDRQEYEGAKFRSAFDSRRIQCTCRDRGDGGRDDSARRDSSQQRALSKRKL